MASLGYGNCCELIGLFDWSFGLVLKIPRFDLFSFSEKKYFLRKYCLLDYCWCLKDRFSIGYLQFSDSVHSIALQSSVYSMMIQLNSPEKGGGCLRHWSFRVIAGEKQCFNEATKFHLAKIGLLKFFLSKGVSRLQQF